MIFSIIIKTTMPHDYSDEQGYHRQCKCGSCQKAYAHWCQKYKTPGQSCCEIKKTIHYTVKCEKPIKKVIKWGYEWDESVDWKTHKTEEPPKNCKCGKSPKHCTCNKNKHQHNKY